MKEEERNELGLKTETSWTPLKNINTRQVYDNLVKRRLKTKNYEPKRAHANIRTIQRNLTAKERDYWWRLTHKLVITKKRESKYKEVSAMCPVCGEDEEDVTHYDYECPKVNEIIQGVKDKTGMTEMSREHWALEAKGMAINTMTVIAKARWIYHKERCRLTWGKGNG